MSTSHTTPPPLIHDAPRADDPFLLRALRLALIVRHGEPILTERDRTDAWDVLLSDRRARRTPASSSPHPKDAA